MQISLLRAPLGTLMTEYRFDDFTPPIPFLTGDAAVLHSIISEVDRVAHLSPEEIQKRQAHYLAPLIHHFSKVSPSFKKRLGKVSLKGNLKENLTKIEPINKLGLQEWQRAEPNVAIPQHHLPENWATTSGSTGTPLKVRGTAITRAIAMAQIPWTHLASGTDFSWRMASVKPTNTVTGESDSWDGASSLLFNVGPLLSLSSSTDIFKQLDALERFKPDILIVFPSVLKEYLCVWKSGIRTPLNLKVVRTMGETLGKGMGEIVKEMTGATLLDTYSSSEIGRIATQVAPNSPYITNNYSLIVEVLNERNERCEPGELGRVVVTDLTNYATPIIRYDIGDWAIPDDPHHHKLREVRGRSRNIIQLPDGRKIWPLVGYREFSEVVPVRQFRIEQVAPDCLKAQFYVFELPSPEAKEKVLRIIRESLDYDFEIEADFQMSPIAKGPNQKLEDFISLTPA